MRIRSKESRYIYCKTLNLWVLKVVIKFNSRSEWAYLRSCLWSHVLGVN